ncbi:MAG TPA: cytochrome b N-terminal domain-containing protein [Tepidisphaeraceae bacterium]|jgi:quinol-cytochrome oxidoreductase complex cytochrome b subunit
MARIQKVYDWFDDRYHVTPLIEKNVTKKRVPRTLGWAACFGGLSLLMFIVQVFTGMLLLMYYKPDPNAAWDSVTFVKSNVSMGWLVQRIHTVGANLMIVMVFMHMARVAYYKIFRSPRELHWISGVVLALLTTIMAFTGYLLPWTQLSYWGAKVGTEIPGAVPIVGQHMVEWVRRGKNISGETLGFFFSLHIWIIPATVTLFMAAHFAMIRRTGISRPL